MKTNIEGWICLYAPTIMNAQPSITFFTHKPQDGSEWLPIREHVISEELGDFDARPAAVTAIDANIAKVRAEFTARITELQEQKSRLLAITMEQA